MSKNTEIYKSLMKKMMNDPKTLSDYKKHIIKNGLESKEVIDKIFKEITEDLRVIYNRGVNGSLLYNQTDEEYSAYLDYISEFIFCPLCEGSHEKKIHCKVSNALQSNKGGRIMAIRIFDSETQNYKKYSIKVNLTDQDLYQLESGELYFDWSFPAEEDENVIINVRVTTGEDVD